MIKLNKIKLDNKRIFLRCDMNVPIKNKKIMSYNRIEESLPTIKFLLKNNAKVIIASHLGNPKINIYNSSLSLRPIAEYLEKILNNKIIFVENYLNGIKYNNNNLFFLENLRFNKGEITNCNILAKKYADLCDIFVMDAFACSHRKHASIHGITKFVPISCTGFLLEKEINKLKFILKNFNKPLVTIVGGAKISTKLKFLYSLSKISDYIIVGGGIANTFIAAKDYNVGYSLYEKNLIQDAKILLKNKKIYYPKDVRTSIEFSNKYPAIQKNIKNISNNDYILDLGDFSIHNMINIINKAKTIIWNGPIGVFEFDNFCTGTKLISLAIANSKAFTVAGGGETIAVINKFNIANKISYISTGGGAFLKFMEKKISFKNF